MERSIAYRLDIGRSHYLLGYFLLVYLMMTLTLVILFADVILLMAFIVISMAISLILQLQKYGWLNRGHAIKMLICNEGIWTVNYFDGSSLAELELKSSYVSPLITLIHLKIKGKWRKITVVILSDAVDSELFRQLRVMLRDPKTFQK